MTNDENDLTDLMVAASAMHELFITFVAAGFTRQEALQIVLAQVTQHGQADSGS